MPHLFLIHSDQDTACAAQLQHDLTAHGYTLWQDADWQQGLRASRGVVVVWSAAAAQAARVQAQIERAQWGHKRVVVVATDGTALPDTLAAAPTIRSAPPCTDAAAQLLPHLPTPDDTPLLHDLLANPPAAAREEASHIIDVRCSNGHITSFDKRDVCRDDGTIERTVVRRTGHDLDALRLRCGTPGCGEWVVAEVDCEGYR